MGANVALHADVLDGLSLDITRLIWSRLTHYNPMGRMRYVMQHRLIHLGSMARIKVDLWGRFLSPSVNFSF